MTIRACILATLFVAGLVTATAAAPPAKKAAVADSTAPKKPAPKPKTTAPSVKGGVRTIDAINIEGEIAVPQVLFITSRDNRRYRDGLGKRFRAGTLDVARSMVAPDRACVAGKSGSESLKEE